MWWIGGSGRHGRRVLRSVIRAERGLAGPSGALRAGENRQPAVADRARLMRRFKGRGGGQVAITTRTDMVERVRSIFSGGWSVRASGSLPDPVGLSLDNEAVSLDAAVLCADLSSSTRIVDTAHPTLATEIYKAYLSCAATLIREGGGEVTAFDGDRIVGMFVGDARSTMAVRVALAINWCVDKVINPTLRTKYQDEALRVRQIVGVDTGDVMAARTEIRGGSDLVWVGQAANYAAKLTELDADYPTWITHRVYDLMDDGVRYYKGQNIWEPRVWRAVRELSIYRSNWWFR
jgi:class 3 adenylate cyclase